MRTGDIMELRRARNWAYWQMLMAKQYSSQFSSQKLEQYTRETYQLSKDLMLGYQEAGNEWWTKKNVKMAYYQTKAPMLLVPLYDFLEELGHLTGKRVTALDYVDPEKREKLYAEAQENYEKYFLPHEVNVIESERGLD